MPVSLSISLSSYNCKYSLKSNLHFVLGKQVCMFPIQVFLILSAASHLYLKEIKKTSEYSLQGLFCFYGLVLYTIYMYTKT